MQLDGCIKMTFLDKNGIFHMGISIMSRFCKHVPVFMTPKRESLFCLFVDGIEALCIPT